MRSYRTVRTSVILVAVGSRVEAYPSLEDVPPELRGKLIKSTSGDDAATILIADRKGREAVLRSLRQTAPGRRTPGDWLRTWGSILLCGAAGSGAVASGHLALIPASMPAGPRMEVAPSRRISRRWNALERKTKMAAAAEKFCLEALLGRHEAEERIGEALSRRAPLCPVAISMDSYSLLVDHFGCRSGDQALAHVARRLPASRLYRWTGGALLVLVESWDEARSLLDALPDRYTVTLSVGDGVVEVRCAVRGKAFPVQLAEPAPELARRIDRWVTMPSLA